MVLYRMLKTNEENIEHIYIEDFETLNPVTKELTKVEIPDDIVMREVSGLTTIENIISKKSIIEIFVKDISLGKTYLTNL